MTSTSVTAAPGTHPRSPFTGADICHEAGLALPDSTSRPVFDDDLWDFTDVVGLPVQMALYRRRFDFTTIDDPRWRLVVKELILALLAPNHDAVVRLPRAYRTPLASDQLLQPALRGRKVLRLARPAGHHCPHRSRYPPLRGVPGVPTLCHRLRRDCGGRAESRRPARCRADDRRPGRLP